MRKIFSASPLALCVLGVLALYGCSGNGLSSLTENVAGDPVPQPPAPQTQHANGVVEDWSTSHVIFPRVGSMSAMKALQNDVRAMQSWRLADQKAVQQSRVPPRFLPIQSAVNRDWSISLGGGTTAPAMYPAKYSFNVNALPDCTNDFVAFPVSVSTGSAGTQPNIVGFNNLYSGGTSGSPTGLCATRTVQGGVTDNLSEATVYWSYNVAAEDGQVSTSPALSLDGAKVAFVETGTGTTAHFHVLAWAQFDGTSNNAQDALTMPVQVTPTGIGFVSAAPVEQSGSATDLALTPSSGTASDTLSSPFVDYAFDVAYVGNDSGTLFRVKNVFCTVPSGPNTVCDDGGTEAPSLDSSWGTNGALTTGCPGALTGPVEDGNTGNIFVGCSDGKLYAFTNTGAALPGSPVTVGSGSGTTGGGIVDPPLIDAANGLVYAVAGASSGGTEVVVQVPEVFNPPLHPNVWTLGTPAIGTLGAGGHFNMHAPAVNNAYLSGGPTATGALLYDWGLNSGNSAIELYAFGFTGSVMSGTPTDSLPLSSTVPVEFSPVTEFENSPNDLLFVSGLVSVPSTAFNFIEYNINSFPTADPPSGGSGSTGATFATAGPGTSGIIVDNASSAAQASSIYYGDLGSNNAVKLTQGDLQ